MKLFLTFVAFAKTWVTISCDFAPKPRDTAQGYLKCVPPHIGDPVVRTDGHVTLTSLPKFLGSIGDQIRSAMVLRWWASPAGSAKKRI